MNFQFKKTYVFRYSLYEEVMRSKGYKPDTSNKQYEGEIFTVQNHTNYVILRKGLSRLTVNPKMCEIMGGN